MLHKKHLFILFAFFVCNISGNEIPQDKQPIKEEPSSLDIAIGLTIIGSAAVITVGTVVFVTPIVVAAGTAAGAKIIAAGTVIAAKTPAAAATTKAALIAAGPTVKTTYYTVGTLKLIHRLKKEVEKNEKERKLADLIADDEDEVFIERLDECLKQ